MVLKLICAASLLALSAVALAEVNEQNTRVFGTYLRSAT